MITLRTAAIAIAVAAAVMAVTAFLWWAAAQIEAGRDAVWRERIATASSKVRELVAKKGTEVMLTDEELIRTLGEGDAALNEAERKLAEAQKAQRDASSQCPRIPAICLR